MKLRHKYNAVRVKDDGYTYASKLEYRYKQKLELLKKAGEVIFYLEQLPFRLPGGVKYICDFMVFYSNGEIDFIDTTGMMTQMKRNKIKQVEELYSPVKINIISKI